MVDGDELEGAEWIELLPESKLEGDSVNRFDVSLPRRITHLRLNIFPDGGVARLRVHGEPLPDLRRQTTGDGRAELASTLSGGVVLGASDVFFSSPHNLVAPGDSHGMHDGWETRRRRGPGHDWVVLRLAAEAEIDRVEVDTSNFKGNYPDTCSLDAARSSDDADLDDGWTGVLPSSKLGPHGRFVFPIDPSVAATHLRLNIHPDGGVARLRVHGRVTDDGWRTFGVRWLNAQSADAFEQEVLACCGSRAWAAGVSEARPFADFDALLEAADTVWAKLDADVRREAFAAHPRIGDREGSAWSRGEQAGVDEAGDDTRRALEEGNREYESRFGHVFLINATGKTAEEMLGELTTPPRQRRRDRAGRGRRAAAADHADPAREARPAGGAAERERRMMPGVMGITTHVLDTSAGRPATGVLVVLEMRRGDAWEPVGQGRTDDDGRLRDLLPDGRGAEPATYRLRFDTAAYFAARGVEGFYPEVTIEFRVTDASEHHHVPLLLSPFGYSTYRGS